MSRRRHHVRALRTAVLALALLAGSAGLGTTAASAAPTAKGTPGYCPDSRGVTVVVDFQELGGTTVVRCAPGDQATGLTALKNAGFRITGTNRWGEAFICRIEGKPGPGSEACIDTPPATAYWSYWHASNGGSWAYSQMGVTNRKPPLGSFEGWSFSKDKTEDTNPPPRVAPRRPAATQPPGGGSGGSAGSGSGGADHGTGGAGTTGGAGGTGGAATGGKIPSASHGPGGAKHSTKPGEQKEKEASTSPSAEPAPGTEETPSEAPGWTGEAPQSAAADDGVPAGTLVAAAAVVLLGSAAGVTAWRRRRDTKNGSSG